MDAESLEAASPILLEALALDTLDSVDTPARNNAEIIEKCHLLVFYLYLQLKSDGIFLLFQIERIIVTQRPVNTKLIETTAFFINFCPGFGKLLIFHP